ncbi:AlbA family DNA-binding domain-containing protein [Streptomyces roseolilacinus]|uniref:AlbA family DNA-binding domain-containing protein n=1 Tax=Streptomyces roseolilacinus TaxID=66904 RepID=UPI003803099B
MTLDFNADEPVVGLARQRELIHAVLNASSADETRWLEWKSHHDVSRAAGAFAVSKAILGFANRMPDVAEQWAGGHAYLLVGVDEDAIHGVPTHDVEKVDGWLRRYLGEFSRYQFTYVPMDTDEGKRHVMLVDVSPPRWGDPLHPLHKEHENYRPGTVFHRYAGRTEPARPAEIYALTDRARRATKRVNVDITMTTGTVAVLAPTEDVRRTITDFLREEMMRQVDAADERRKAVASDPFGAFRPLQVLWPDSRSPEEFRQEVDEYLSDFDLAMQHALAQAVSGIGTPLTLTLTNPGEDNLTQVQVVLSLPDTVTAHVTADTEEEVDWPHQPAKYGEGTIPALGVHQGVLGVQPYAYHLPSLHSPDIEQQDGHTVIRFAPVDLRPHETVTLDPITVYSSQEADSFVSEWRATATNVSSKAQGSLSIPAQRLDLDLWDVLPVMHRVDDTEQEEDGDN